MVTITRYIYDGNQYLAEANEHGTINRLYTNEPDAYTHLISQEDVSTGDSLYYHYDAIGSTRQVTNDTETVTDEFTYDAWGNRLSRTGTSDIPFQYVGEHGYYRESKTDLYHVMERVYDPHIIRWMSADPIEYTYHAYSYSGNNAVNYLDPSGMLEITKSTPRLNTGTNGCGKPQYTLTTIKADFNTKKRTDICYGYVVQKVTVSCFLVKCDLTDFHAEEFSYYEVLFDAFKSARSYSDTDRFGNLKNLAPEGYCFSFKMVGESRFYCQNEDDIKRIGKKPSKPTGHLGSTRGDADAPGWRAGRHKPDTYGVHNLCKVTVRKTPSYPKDSRGAQPGDKPGPLEDRPGPPEFWGSPQVLPPSVNHDLKIVSRCCRDPRYRIVLADYNPKL